MLQVKDYEQRIAYRQTVQNPVIHIGKQEPLSEMPGVRLPILYVTMQPKNQSSNIICAIGVIITVI